MAEPFLGEIRMFGGNFAPSGWQMCNGQTLAISQYAALFSILGTTFGGNGTSTFQLPNMQGRVPIHWGTGAGLSTYVIGEQAGTENVTLLFNNMPIHTHLVNAVNAGGQTSPSNNFPGAVSSAATEKLYSAGPGNVTMAATMIGPAGGNVPHSNLQPLLCVTFIIAMVGIFPSRN
jgi:microcystin-dependent protein